MHEEHPGGSYNSVYEAGFSGYWAHRQLEQLGFNNKVASPNEVPTNGKEKIYKTDTVDSRKLARELESGSIKGIYIPRQLEQELAYRDCCTTPKCHFDPAYRIGVNLIFLPNSLTFVITCT